VVCLGYKAPAKIDPRLLDPKHLFQEVAEAPKIMGPEALLKAKIKQKRHRWVGHLVDIHFSVSTKLGCFLFEVGVEQPVGSF
jgi:hypothetical protein